MTIGGADALVGDRGVAAEGVVQQQAVGEHPDQAQTLARGARLA